MRPVGRREVHGLVLRSTDIGETSRLVVLFTGELGRITVKAKGLRKTLGKFQGVLEPFNLIEATVHYREGVEIMTFIEGSVLESNTAIRADVERGGLASVWAELLDRVESEAVDAPAVLDWVHRALECLAGARWPRAMATLAAWQLIGLLGYRPVLDRCVVSGERHKRFRCFSLSRGGVVADEHADPADETLVRLSPDVLKILERSQRAGLGQLARIRASRTQADALLHLFDQFCRYHLDISLRSVQFIKALASGRTR